MREKEKKRKAKAKPITRTPANLARILQDRFQPLQGPVPGIRFRKPREGGFSERSGKGVLYHFRKPGATRIRPDSAENPGAETEAGRPVPAACFFHPP